VKEIKKLNRGMVRSLLMAQNGRCAISGEKIKPSEVALDHIVAISRRDLNKKKGYGEGWLVSKKINALKGTLTMNELYYFIEKIRNNKKKTKSIFDKIINNKLKPVEKERFDEYIKRNYSKDGLIKK
jgi:hypothetical protein|tara:strand:+ start:582 stop:962 length:381 start_codon:yes stop_codon:yes gene_type:complete